MSDSRYSGIRVLAIDPAVRGLGYAVIEGGTRLVDWGGRDARHGETNQESLRRVEALILRYEPDVLIIEDCGAKGSRRRPRVERLMRGIERVALAKGLTVRKIARARVDEAFFSAKALNKHEVAIVIAKRFPTIAAWLPPARRLWMTEHHRTNIFDAVALGLTFFSLEEDERRTA